MSLVQRFLAEEGRAYVKARLEKVDASQVLVEFNFNVFDMLVDFERELVRVDDSLDTTKSEEMPLAQFRSLLAG